MRHLLLLLLLVLLLLPTTAAAQWRHAVNADGALAWVHTAAGSSISLRCQPGAAHANRLRVELIVWPTNTREPTEEVARIDAGRYTFSLEMLPEGPAFVNRRLYAGSYDFDDPVMRNFRAQLAGASVAVLEDGFDFRGDRFGLRGSRAAITQLEAACPRVWAAGAPAAATPDAAPSTGWRVSGDTFTASVAGPGGTRFAIGCAPFGRVADLHWSVELPLADILPASTPALAARTSDGTTIRFGNALDASGGEYDPNRPFPYMVPFRPGPRETFLQAISGQSSWLEIAATSATGAVRFDLRGAEAAVSAVLDACGHTAVTETSAVDAPPSSPSAVPREALDGLREYVVSLVATSCFGGTRPTIPDSAFDVEGPQVTVRVNEARCSWNGGTNPYCGAQLCQVWVYRWDGRAFTLIGQDLQ